MSNDKQAPVSPPVSEAVWSRIVDGLTVKPTVFNLGPEQQIAFVPEGAKIEDLARFMPKPPRVQQRVKMLTVESFLAYVNRFKGPPTTIFADETAASYEAVIDYHPDSAILEATKQASGYGHQDHVASYACPRSQSWDIWTAQDGKFTDQVTFAQFLEANLPDISQPSGATFLEVALALQVHKTAEFASDVRLDNGQQNFRYEENIKGTTRAGDLTIPSSFVIKIPVFVDGEKHEIPARFKYRMDAGKLILGFDLIRPKEVFQKAVKAVTEQIRGGTQVFLHAGTRGAR